MNSLIKVLRDLNPDYIRGQARQRRPIRLKQHLQTVNDQARKRETRQFGQRPVDAKLARSCRPSVDSPLHHGLLRWSGWTPDLVPGIKKPAVAAGRVMGTIKLSPAAHQG